MAVTQRRRMEDFAYQIRWLTDEVYTKGERIRVVLDNLNTHRPASLYVLHPKDRPGGGKADPEALGVPLHPRARQLAKMAEIELSVLSRQCLGRRIPDDATLQREVAALEQQR